MVVTLFKGSLWRRSLWSRIWTDTR